jgi:uncharacterized protein YjbI with pentapeptide repeats
MGSGSRDICFKGFVPLVILKPNSETIGGIVKKLASIAIATVCAALGMAISGLGLAVADTPAPCPNITQWRSGDFSNRDFRSCGTLDYGYTVGAANFENANVSGITILRSLAIGSNFTGASADDTTFSGSIGGANFKNASLKHANFQSAALSDNCDFENLNIKPGVVFDGANLEGADFSHANLQSTPNWCANGSHSSAPPGSLSFRNANLRNANLQGLRALDVDFTGADLTGANLYGLRASNIDFTGSDLTDATFAFVNAQQVNFTRAILRGANLNFADAGQSQIGQYTSVSQGIIGQPLPGSDGFSNYRVLGGCFFSNFSNSICANGNFDHQDLTGMSLFHQLFSNSSFVGSQFGGSILNGTVFQDCDLTNADLSNTSLYDSRFTNSRLVKSNLSGAYLDSTTKFAGTDLTNSNFAGATMGDVNLSGMDLTGVDLSGDDLSLVNLSKAVTSHIVGSPSKLPTGWFKFQSALIGPNANLKDANLASADLNFSDLSGANLSGVRSGGVTKAGKLPTGWKLVGGYLIGPEANLTGADLSYSDLRNTNFRGANLSNAVVTAAQLDNSDFSFADLKNITALGASLTNSVLSNSDISNAYLVAASLRGVKSGSVISDSASLPQGWVVIGGYLIGAGANLTNANLTGLNLAGVSLDAADLTGATLSAVKSGQIRGGPSHLPSNWGLYSGYLIGPGADVSSASLANANLTGVMTGQLLGQPSSLPKGWVLYRGYLVGRGANLTGADLTGMSLEGVDLRDTTLRGTISGSLAGEPIGLDPGYKVVKGYLVGPYVSLGSADLENADLSTVDLMGADFRNAKLSGVMSGGYNNAPALLPEKWSFVSGYLVGPGANLSGANLRGANLSKLDLTGANLSDANLQNAIIEGVNLSSVTLTGLSSGGLRGVPALKPSKWQIRNGYLVGPSADLEGANLNGATLIAMDLSDANLKGANLRYANILAVNFSGATLTGLISGGITGDPSVLPEKWVLRNGFLFGPGVDLSGSDLSGLDLGGLDLSSSNISKANISNTDFSSTLISGIVSENLVGTPKALPSGWVFWNKSIVLVQNNLVSPVLTGDPRVGLTIHAENGAWDPSASVSYIWLRNGKAISTALDDTSYQLALEDFRAKVSVQVTVKLDGYKTELLISQPVNVLPGFLKSVSVPTVSGSAVVGGFLSASAGVWDQGVAFQYQWLRDGSVITGATGSTYVPVVADFGRNVSVQVTGSLTGFDSVSKVSAVQLIGAGKLALAPVPTVSGSAVVGGSLSASAGVWNQGVAFQYQWLRDGSVIPGATGSVYVPVVADFGRNVSVQVTGSLTGFDSVSKVSSVQAIGAGRLALAPVPSVAGSAVVGGSLAASAGVWDQGVAFQYQWLRDGSAISGAIGSTYLLTVADFGHSVSVQVTGTATGYATVVQTSTAQSVVAGKMPSGSAKTSGTAKVGKSLTVAMSPLVQGAKITYQWLLDGKKIKGATKSTLKLTATYKKHKVAVVVTQSAVGYNTVSVTSGAVKIG